MLTPLKICLALFGILLAAQGQGVAARGHFTSEDSIVVDGRVIRVQASVELDTVSRPRRWQFGWNVPGPDERRPIKRRPPAWKGGELWGRMPLGTGGRLDTFSQGLPGAGTGVGWTHVAPRPGRRAWGLGGQIQLQACPSVDFATALPDSTIGFLPGEGASVRAVTWERFDLGVETDTVVVDLARSWTWGGALAGVLQVELSRNTPLEFAFGMERYGEARTLIRVAEPAIGGDPVQRFEVPGRQWQPMARVGVAHFWGRPTTTRWGVGLGVVWRPAEPDPVSVRAQLAVSLPAR